MKIFKPPKYCLFYDNHTMSAYPEVGKNFDVEAFTNRIKSCGVDQLIFHSRCNQGMAYYNTKTGIMHPSLKFDLFGKLAQTCRQKDIALIAYFHAGLSSAEGLLHRDWTTLYFNGHEYTEPRSSPYVRTMCWNTPYRDHLIAMIEEVARNYPVSGFFIDGFSGFPCICPVCVKEMKKKGVDWQKEEEVIRFSDFSALRLAKDIAKAVRAVHPDFRLYFKGIPYEDQTDICSWTECVNLASTSSGYEYLPVLSHYLRTLGNKPVVNMVGRFYDWGDFGGLRPEAAIKSELLYGLANGMRPNIGGHFHPRGDLENAVLDRIEKIYKDFQIMEPWFDGATNLTEIAIVYSANKKDISAQALNDGSLRASVRILSELKQQFDVVTEFSDWNKYKVLVIPDDIYFTDETARRVEAHIAAGKAVISSGSSGLNLEKKHFALEKEWGIKYKGDNDFSPAYFRVKKNFNDGLPDMPLSLYSSGIEVEVLPGTTVGANLVRSYYNRGWNGEYAFCYNPPDEETDKPALTVIGKVAHFSHRIFSGYNTQASVELRTLFSNVLNIFLTYPLLRAEGLPSFARGFVTQQPERKMVHILSYVPELRGKTEMIEEGITLYNIKLTLRHDNQIPRKVYMAPEMKPLPFKIEGMYISVAVPECKGYTLIVFEN